MIQIEDNELTHSPAYWLWAKALVNFQLAKKLNAETFEQAGNLQWEQLQQRETWLKSTAFADCLTVTPWRLWLLEP